MRSRHLIWIEGWLRERFPRHSNIYFGLSGTTLLSDALAFQPQHVAVLPGFFCPVISLMTLRVGKQVVHIDSDPDTLHPRLRQLQEFLSARDPANTILLIDHTFGYPFTGLGRLRQDFPDLLIIEDCARALGVEISGRPPGDYSDWLLLSMYKTIPGSQSGAILLTRAPLEMHPHPSAPVTLRECAAACRPLRAARAWIRPRPSFGARCPLSREPEWQRVHGTPSRLCASRFRRELAEFENRRQERRAIFSELREALSRIPGIEPIAVADGGGAASHFVSFKIAGSTELRDSVLTALGGKRMELSRVWELLPFHYECFAGTFPVGSAGAAELGDRIVHIPVRWLNARERRRTLLRELRGMMERRPLSESQNVLSPRRVSRELR